jgi:hypothetical protein
MELIISVGGRVNFLFRNINHIKVHRTVLFAKHRFLIQSSLSNLLSLF